MSRLMNFYVEGWENGGVELTHGPCKAPVASGGCTCCEGQMVSLFDLVQASKDHLCEEKASC